MVKRGEGWGLRFAVVTLIGGSGCTNKGVEIPISTNTGGRAEVMLTKTLKTGGGGGVCGSPLWL